MSFQIIVSVGDSGEVVPQVAPPGAQVPLSVALGALEVAKMHFAGGLLKQLVEPEKKIVAAPAGTLRQLPPRPPTEN